MLALLPRLRSCRACANAMSAALPNGQLTSASLSCGLWQQHCMVPTALCVPATRQHHLHDQIRSVYISSSHKTRDPWVKSNDRPTQPVHPLACHGRAPARGALEETVQSAKVRALCRRKVIPSTSYHRLR